MSNPKFSKIRKKNNETLNSSILNFFGISYLKTQIMSKFENYSDKGKSKCFPNLKIQVLKFSVSH